MRFPDFSQAHQYQLRNSFGSFFGTAPVHPTQIYESLAAIVGSLLAIYLIRKKSAPGIAILPFGLWLSFFRLLNMQLRVMPATLDVPYFFYPIFYASVMIVCMGLWYKKLNKKI